MMKKITFYIFLGSLFLSCKGVTDDMPQKSKIIARSISDNETRGVNAENPIINQLLFTGDDIAWFNPATREIKFTNITPDFYSLPMYAQIDICIGEEKLFTAVHINAIVSHAYNDLVLFYDYNEDSGTGKYYLNDCYPSGLNIEGIQKNIEARAKGWTKFLAQLKTEHKLK